MNEPGTEGLFEPALWQFLKDNSKISAIVGSRIYPTGLPQPPVFPAVTYSLISRSPTRDLSGTVFWNSRFQLTCWSMSYKEAKALAQSIKIAIDGYTDSIGDFKIIDSQIGNEVDLKEPETGLHYVPVDALIKHK